MSNQIGVKEAAKILGLSKKTVYTKLRSGQILGEKIQTKYGQKWVIDKEQLEDQAAVKNEVVEVKEINELVNREDLMNELIEAVNGQNKELIDEEVDNITDKLDRQERAITELTEEVKRMREQRGRGLLKKIKAFLSK
ncbi:MAG: helix-turn-helix domain-containing protein [Halanaerobiaceae bacterium]